MNTTQTPEIAKEDQIKDHAAFRKWLGHRSDKDYEAGSYTYEGMKSAFTAGIEHGRNPVDWNKIVGED